jgi:hypothetical protein
VLAEEVVDNNSGQEDEDKADSWGIASLLYIVY